MSVYRFIAVEKDGHRVSTLSRTLGASRLGFYAWTGWPPSARRREDEAWSNGFAPCTG